MRRRSRADRGRNRGSSAGWGASAWRRGPARPRRACAPVLAVAAARSAPPRGRAAASSWLLIARPSRRSRMSAAGSRTGGAPPPTRAAAHAPRHRRRAARDTEHSSGPRRRSSTPPQPFHQLRWRNLGLLCPPLAHRKAVPEVRDRLAPGRGRYLFCQQVFQPRSAGKRAAFSRPLRYRASRPRAAASAAHSRPRAPAPLRLGHLQPATSPSRHNRSRPTSHACGTAR